MTSAVLWQRVEGALVFGAAVLLYLYSDQPFGLWLALLVFFAPDLTFAGYALGPKVGAFCYNCLHLYGLGVALHAAGIVFDLPVLAGIGLLWLAHAGFDRMLGYGLKLVSGFSDTHLGRIGRSRDQKNVS